MALVIPKLEWSQAIPVCRPHTKQWYNERDRGIGASEIAAAVGISDWEQPLSVWQRKRAALGRKVRGATKETLAMKIGTALEDTIKAEFVATHGPLQCKTPFMYRAWDGSYLFATPDGIVEDKVLLECKTCGQWGEDKWGDSHTDIIPKEYYAQVQYQMGVMGADACWVAVLFKRLDEVRYYRIERNQQIITRLFFAAERFWDMVTAGTEPPVDWAHRTTPDVVRELTTTVETSVCELADGWASEWDEYQELGKIEAAVKERREYLKSRVMYAIGDFGGGVLPDGRFIARKVIQRDGYTVQPSSYVRLSTKKNANGNQITGRVEYVAVEDAKQPKRIGFTEPDHRVSGAVCEVAAVSSDG